MTIVLTIVIVGALMTGMAVGVMFTGRSLKGSCGGPGGAECACEKAGTPNACADPDATSPSGKAPLPGRTADNGVTLYN